MSIFRNLTLLNFDQNKLVHYALRNTLEILYSCLPFFFLDYYQNQFWRLGLLALDEAASRLTR